MKRFQYTFFLHYVKPQINLLPDHDFNAIKRYRAKIYKEDLKNAQMKKGIFNELKFKFIWLKNELIYCKQIIAKNERIKKEYKLHFPGRAANIATYKRFIENQILKIEKQIKKQK